jgi:isoleucyl-tRNA synthetase
LWVTASDYRDDIRISPNILKQLSDAYRRIRNTSRFLLGNLFDFDPQRDMVAYEHMPEIDRFALHKLQSLLAKAQKAYANFEFHIIYHGLYNYCTLDLSAFYLDILKDRLYTSPADSTARRSAQTVIYFQMETLARMMAPILAFTAEEIWRYLPPADDRPASVHLAAMPEVPEKWKDEALAAKWARLIELRGEVTKALEQARADKLIGHPLDAALIISVNRDWYAHIAPYAEDLRSLFIVSKAELVEGQTLADAYTSDTIEGLQVKAEPAKDEKCDRCWVHDGSVGGNAEHPQICARCQKALQI